jgi:hypothetical protein
MTEHSIVLLSVMVTIVYLYRGSIFRVLGLKSVPRVLVLVTKSRDHSTVITIRKSCSIVTNHFCATTANNDIRCEY